MNAARNLIIIGGGEHARVVAEIARSRPDDWNTVGFVDIRARGETSLRLGLRQFESDEEALANVGSCWFVLGIGQIGSLPLPLRRELVARYTARGARWAAVVHASAQLSPTATVNDGAVISAGAIVNCGAVIGAHCVINTGAIIEHDVRVGDFALIGPGAVVGGGAEIGEGSYLGLGCRVRDHIHIGRGVTVGMGAVVVKPLPDGVQAVGVPAVIQAKR
jgi:acetyltransferase EpsM